MPHFFESLQMSPSSVIFRGKFLKEHEFRKSTELFVKTDRISGVKNEEVEAFRQMSIGGITDARQSFASHYHIQGPNPTW